MTYLKPLVFPKLLGAALLLINTTIGSEWTAQNGSIDDEANWLNGEVPGANDEARINNGGTALINGSFDVQRLTLGLNGGSGSIEQTDGIFTASGAFIGDTGMGSATISGGTFDIGNDSIHVGWRPGGDGTLTINNKDTSVFSGDDIQFGREGTGILEFEAGTMRGGFTVVGKFGTGIWNQSGGLFDQDFGDLEIGDGGRDDQAGTAGPRIGTVNLTSGTIQTAGHLAIGNRRGTGTLNVSGGVVAATGGETSSIFVGRGADTAIGAGGPVAMRVTGDDAIIIANGDFIMNASEAAVSSTLVAELTGPTHTSVQVSGSADIANGTLRVELNGYSPKSGDNWTLIEAGVELDDLYEVVDSIVEADGYEPLTHGFAAIFGELDGEFAIVDTSLAQLSPGLSWEIGYTDNAVILGVSGKAIIPGDFDNNGILEAADIDALTTAVREMSDELLFDVDGSGVVDAKDREFWVNELRKTFFGDSNLDGEFNSSDFVKVFQAGEYEDEITGNSTWATGDWNGDGDFSSGDFVAAFQAGGFEKGPRDIGISDVPEPITAVPFVILVLMLIIRSKTATPKSDCR